ncbi:hypothetical protein FRC11_002207, partial [Ceratobasidium sp. 423]
EAPTARSATEMYRSQSHSQSRPCSVASGTYTTGSETYHSEGSYQSGSDMYQTHDSDTYCESESHAETPHPDTYTDTESETYHAGSGSEGGISGFASQLYPPALVKDGRKAYLAKDALKARIVKVIPKERIVKAGQRDPIVKVVLRVHTTRVALRLRSAKVIPRAATVKAGPRATTAKDTPKVATPKVRLLQAPTSVGHLHIKIHKHTLPPTPNPPPMSLAPKNTAKALKPILKKKLRRTLEDRAPLPLFHPSPLILHVRAMTPVTPKTPNPTAEDKFADWQDRTPQAGDKTRMPYTAAVLLTPHMGTPKTIAGTMMPKTQTGVMTPHTLGGQYGKALSEASTVPTSTEGLMRQWISCEVVTSVPVP